MIGSTISWWALGICVTLYGAGFIHGATFANWTHRKMTLARAYRRAVNAGYHDAQ